MTIRPASPGDAQGIATVKIASWREGYAHILPAEYLAALDQEKQEERYFNDIMAGGHFLVAEEHGAVVAFSLWQEFQAPDVRDPTDALNTIHTDWPHKNTVASLYVHPDFYRQGLGTALLRACASKALERGHHGMMIGVFRDNHRAKNVYFNLGAELFKTGWFAVDGINYPEEILIFSRGSKIFLP